MALLWLPTECSEKNFTLKMEAVVSSETPVTRELSTRTPYPRRIWYWPSQAFRSWRGISFKVSKTIDVVQLTLMKGGKSWKFSERVVGVSTLRVRTCTFRIWIRTFDIGPDRPACCINYITFFTRTLLLPSGDEERSSVEVTTWSHRRCAPSSVLALF
jgi:hypothetical protein